MREIKFRAWAYGKMYSWDHMNDTEKLTGDFLRRALTSEHYIAMQFTGLKDKNGKEIYEGDILKFSDSFSQMAGVGEVEYSEGMFFVGGGGLRGLINAQIIGNKFENPELLKGTP